jgi:hypothetical protein
MILTEFHVRKVTQQQGASISTVSITELDRFTSRTSCQATAEGTDIGGLRLRDQP